MESGSLGFIWFYMITKNLFRNKLKHYNRGWGGGLRAINSLSFMSVKLFSEDFKNYCISMMYNCIRSDT